MILIFPLIIQPGNKILFIFVQHKNTATMYPASLNYDRYFKKVFSDLSIAKQFYVYHSLNSALQLEWLPKKIIPLPGNKPRKVEEKREYAKYEQDKILSEVILRLLKSLHESESEAYINLPELEKVKMKVVLK